MTKLRDVPQRVKGQVDLVAAEAALVSVFTGYVIALSILYLTILSKHSPFLMYLITFLYYCSIPISS